VHIIFKCKNRLPFEIQHVLYLLYCQQDCTTPVFFKLFFEAELFAAILIDQ